MIFEKYGNISQTVLTENISWKVINEPFPNPENRETYIFVVEFYFRKREIVIDEVSSWNAEVQREKSILTVSEMQFLTVEDIKQAIRNRYTSEYANLVALTEEFSGIAGLSE